MKSGKSTATKRWRLWSGRPISVGALVETFVERMTTRLRTTYVPLRDRQPPEGPDQRENGEAEDEELEDRDGGLRVLPVERAADRNAPREPLAQLRDSAVEPASRRPTRWLADRCAFERS